MALSETAGALARGFGEERRVDSRAGGGGPAAMKRRAMVWLLVFLGTAGLAVAADDALTLKAGHGDALVEFTFGVK